MDDNYSNRKFMSIYKSRKQNASWGQIAKHHGYKNANAANAAYYQWKKYHNITDDIIVMFDTSMNISTENIYNPSGYQWQTPNYNYYVPPSIPLPTMDQLWQFINSRDDHINHDYWTKEVKRGGDETKPQFYVDQAKLVKFLGLINDYNNQNTQ